MGNGRFDPKSHQTFRAIRSARELVGQTPAELAAALTDMMGEEISVEVVYNLETGRKRVTDDLLRAISAIHGLSLDYYVDGPVSMMRATRPSRKWHERDLTLVNAS